MCHPAQLAQAQYRSALHLFPPTASGWSPEVLTYSGYYELGIPEVWDMIDRYFAFVKANGYFDARRHGSFAAASLVLATYFSETKTVL